MLKKFFLSAALLLPCLWQSAFAQANYDEPGCNELYLLASQLEKGSQRFRSPLFNEKTNVLATTIGSVTSIGYYYFGFTITRDYYEDYKRHQVQQDLDSVRYLMAQKYCFQKS